MTIRNNTDRILLVDGMEINPAQDLILSENNFSSVRIHAVMTGSVVIDCKNGKYDIKSLGQLKGHESRKFDEFGNKIINISLRPIA